MAIAMTVGATKIQILQEKALGSLPGGKDSENQARGKGDPIGEKEACFV